MDVERYCCDLAKTDASGRVVEAWMDVCAQFPGCCHLWRLDVTIYSTFASYYNTEKKPGVAAEAGIRDKKKRYGDVVLAIAYEPLGRLSVKSVDGLWLLAKEAASLKRHGSAADIFRKWRLQLEHALAWSVAEKALVALGQRPTV